jgi:hypothetical protein
MSGQLPWSLSSSQPATSDPNELLQRIEQNTSNQLMWTKILVIAIGILIVVFLLV